MPDVILNRNFTLSIVSHGQLKLVLDLLNDLDALPEKNFEVIVTLNLPEDDACFYDYSFPLRVIKNVKPKGFGSNHNAAFNYSEGKFYVVVNPDVRINSLDFNELISPLSDPMVAAVAPLVLSPTGCVEDSARRFPTLLRFMRRVVFRQRNSDYVTGELPQQVDWVAGMFVLFRREIYHRLGGFDDRRFYMYLEDVDICRRLQKMGLKTFLVPRVQVIHMAQRASRRSLKHMRWHFISAFRYLTGL